MNISTTKQEQGIEDSQMVSNQVNVNNNNIEFADIMHRKLQDLDLMLMKDKGVTTIAKIVFQFDERIRGKQFFLNLLIQRYLQWESKCNC